MQQRSLRRPFSCTADYRRSSCLLALLILLSATGEAATLHYEAFLAGVRVGAATVTVDLNGQSYAIRGDASATGVAYLFSDWRSEFHAGGRIVNGHPQLLAYGYNEHERRKQRILVLEDGLIHMTKNGKPGAPVPVLDGLDVLTAFFIQPDCWESQLLHTGRSNYRVEGRPAGRAGGCLFEVADDDGDRQRMVVEFGHRSGLVVPVKMTTRGLLRGSIVLRSAQPSAEIGAAP